jgi:hypothetical protein
VDIKALYRNRFAWLLWSLAALPAPAFAAGPPWSFELTPTVGYRVGGSLEDSATGDSVDLEDHGTYGLIVNIAEKPNTQYEFGWSHQDTSVDLIGTNNPDRLDIAIDFLQLGGTYLFDGRQARPYIVATIGAAHYRSKGADSDSDTYFAFSVGGGWQLWPTRRFGLRLEGRYYGTLVDSNSRIFCASTPTNSGCLIQTRGELISQWELTAGGILRF